MVLREELPKKKLSQRRGDAEGEEGRKKEEEARAEARRKIYVSIHLKLSVPFIVP